MSDRIIEVTPGQFDRLCVLANRCVNSFDWPTFDEAAWLEGSREILGADAVRKMLDQGGTFEVKVVYTRLESPTSRAQMPQDGPEGPNARHPSAGSGLDAWERA